MAMNISELQSKLADALPGADVHVDNLRNDGRNHILVHVTATQFSGLSRLDQHRIVFKALKGRFDFEKEFLSLRTEEKVK